MQPQPPQPPPGGLRFEIRKGKDGKIELVPVKPGTAVKQGQGNVIVIPEGQGPEGVRIEIREGPKAQARPKQPKKPAHENAAPAKTPQGLELITQYQEEDGRCVQALQGQRIRSQARPRPQGQ